MEDKSEKLRKRLLAWIEHQRVPNADAEDIVQNVFTTLSERYRDRPEDEKAALAFGIARHQLALWRRNRIARYRVTRHLSDVSPRSGASGPLEALADSEAREILFKRVLAQLSPIALEVLRDRILHGKTYDEIARRLGTHPAAVRVRLFRTVMSLQRMIADLRQSDE